MLFRPIFQCLEEVWLPSYCLEELSSEEAEELRLTSAETLELELEALLEEEQGDLGLEVAGSLLSVKGSKEAFPQLSHQACDRFGVWASTRVEDHPLVTLKIGVDIAALKSLKFKQPKQPQSIQCSCLADTGAQIDVMGAFGEAGGANRAHQDTSSTESGRCSEHSESERGPSIKVGQIRCCGGSSPV